jgi:hypothetical protein
MATALRTDHVSPASDRCVVNNRERFCSKLSRRPRHPSCRCRHPINQAHIPIFVFPSLYRVCDFFNAMRGLGENGLLPSESYQVK